MYYYNTLYIDKNGDTIIKDQMIIKPLDRTWLGIIRDQESVDYIFQTDIEQFNKYHDPDLDFYKHQQKYYQKHHKLKWSPKERTGGYLVDSTFFLHPPRTNQFRMLYYGAYPDISYNLLLDSITKYSTVVRMLSFGVMRHQYQVSPLKESAMKIIDKDVLIWKIDATSTAEFTNEYYKQFHIYNSILDAEFCKEYGFIKMHYTFENGIKIQFDFVKMEVI